MVLLGRKACGGRAIVVRLGRLRSLEVRRLHAEQGLVTLEEVSRWLVRLMRMPLRLGLELAASVQLLEDSRRGRGASRVVWLVSCIRAIVLILCVENPARTALLPVTQSDARLRGHPIIAWLLVPGPSQLLPPSSGHGYLLGEHFAPLCPDEPRVEGVVLE